MIPTLDALRAAGVVSPLDVHFARTLGRLSDDPRSPALVAAALLSQKVRDGHVCMDLLRLDVQAPAGQRWPEAEALAQELSTALRQSPLVSDGSAATPLVLDPKGRLYLRRYWLHERVVAGAIQARALRVDTSIDARVLTAGLQRLFPATPGHETPDRQRLAALMAVRRAFCVVSGGPGTGKTHTVVKILALLVEQALCAGRAAPLMTLVAPTGKAAAWLTESIRRAKGGLDCGDPVRAAIVEEASTIHRALGPIRGTSTRFRRDESSPLAADLVLVDEASMVNIALMARLVRALPPHCRLILLGDRDQLASVEAGAVLGDICNTGGDKRHSRALAADVESLCGDVLPLPDDAPARTGIWDCVVHLQHSYRYGPGSGIAALSRAINAGDAPAALEVLGSGDHDDVALVAPGPPGQLGPTLREQVLSGYRPYLTEGAPQERLQRLERFRVLCGHRVGPGGVDALNLLVRDALREAGLIAGRGEHYAGRPVMVSQNDHGLRLFNGDVGLELPDPARPDAGLRVYFTGIDSRPRALGPLRLPRHDTAFAITVHKSQGSEFDEVAVVLPDRPSAVVTRELLYTAVTRARRRVTIHATADILANAISQRVERRSGLRAALWDPGPVNQPSVRTDSNRLP